MGRVKITPKTHEIADHAGLYLGFEEAQIDINGTVYARDIVTIGEDCSDMLIQYLVNPDGTLTFRLAPCYIEDLPGTIFDSAQLKRVVKYIADNNENF